MRGDRHPRARAHLCPSRSTIDACEQTPLACAASPSTVAPYRRGLDIAANQGAPIRATADGTIDSAGYAGNYGNAVVGRHGFGISTRYGHMSRIAVRTGMAVKRVDVIGYVGATGRATSAHLHYEILHNGQTNNPLRLLARP